MTSARFSSAKRIRTIGAALAALLAAGALAVHGRASAESPAGHARRGEAGVFSTPLSVDWKFTGNYFGSNPAAPVFADGTAYFVCGNAVYAVSCETGGLKWRYPAEVTAFMPKFCIYSPAIDNGRLYVSAPDGVYAMDAGTGALQWRFNPAGRSQVVTSPIVQGSLIYFGAQDGRFYSINAATGEPGGGAYAPPKRPAGVEMGGDLACEPTVSGGDLYYVTANQEVHDLNLVTGVQRWAMHVAEDVATAKPVFYSDGFFLAAGNTFSNWHSANGQIRWSIPLPTDAAVPPVCDGDGNAYLILSDRTMYRINVHGKGVWKKAARLDNRPLTQPILAGNLLIVTTALGGISAYDTATGELRWNYAVQASSENPASVPIGTSVAARPSVVGDTLFALSDDGTLTAFRHDAVDTDAPEIDKLEPENGAYINGRPPVHFSAHIVDEGSGLDLKTLKMMIDDQPLPRKSEDTLSSSNADNGFSYRSDTSTVEYTTLENESGKSATFADGHHTVTVSVKDWKGNETNKTWTFVTDDTIKRVQKNDNYNNNGRGGNGSFPGAGGGPIGGGKGQGR